MKLNGKTAVVTGAGSGIGRAIAEVFAQEGARVVIAGRTPEKLQAVAQDLSANQPEAGRRLIVRAADISNRGSVKELFAFARNELGQVDILVNNAGANVTRRALNELSVEDFEHMVQVNLTGQFYCIHEVLPHMRERGDGLIINISSTAGVRVSTVAGAGYCASKHGLSALSLAIGLEEGGHGIRSCIICPGEVNTPILDKRPVVPDAERRAKMLQPEDVAAAALLVASLHPRAAIPELVIAPAIQKFA